VVSTLTSPGLASPRVGTYKPSSKDVTIKQFSASIGVIASKQRPRRMAMLGSDGNQYQFLLKGHEDLRQDERCPCSIFYDYV
jgi:phosphatidylinositol kinase/protein kinase (PI-3  family)